VVVTTGKNENARSKAGAVRSLVTYASSAVALRSCSSRCAGAADQHELIN
jgi:hypothetical protein